MKAHPVAEDNLPNSFVSKVLTVVRFGFAAGCAAVAMPRRQQPDYSIQKQFPA